MESAGDALKSVRKDLNAADHARYLSVRCTFLLYHDNEDATKHWADVYTYTIAPRSPRAPSTEEAPSLQEVVRK